MSKSETTDESRAAGGLPRIPQPVTNLLETVRVVEPWRHKGPLILWVIGVISHLHFAGDCREAWRHWEAMAGEDQGGWLNTASRMLAGDYCNG